MRKMDRHDTLVLEAGMRLFRQEWGPYQSDAHLACLRLGVQHSLRSGIVGVMVSDERFFLEDRHVTSDAS